MTEVICINCTPKTNQNNQNDNQNTNIDVSLSSYSAKDKPWDTHRGQAQDVQRIYGAAMEFERYARRIGDCSGVLRFGQQINQDTGEIQLKLRETFFCRVRHCPVCQWRRSLMWQARFYQALPELEQHYPKTRWLFLTLTVKNCPIEDLKTTLQAMNQAWQRFIKRKEFKPVQGFIRTTEVTRSKTGEAHPHFHILLMVPPSYFKGGNYVRQSRWTEVWQDCLRVTYTPVVHIQTVKNLNKDDPRTGLQRAVSETLKYSVKPDDMIDYPEWFLEMTKQVHKMRFVATGGALKDVLRVDDETQEGLTLADAEAAQPDDGKRIAFNWRTSERQYRRFSQADSPPVCNHGGEES